MEIIVKGAHGVGKGAIAEAIAAHYGFPIHDEWNGVVELPDNVVAVTNVSAIQPGSNPRLVIEVIASRPVSGASGQLAGHSAASRSAGA